MSNQQPSTEDRELSLISNVEFRIALADTDEKLEAILQKYLAPLLLKLASPYVAVRNKIIEICQHINTRIQPLTIELPLSALLKQFKDINSQLVRHFDLIYIKLALDRLSPSARAELLPELVQGVSQLEEAETDAASAFNLILKCLSALKLPRKGSEDDIAFREKLGITPQDARFLSKWIGNLILLLPSGDRQFCAPLSDAEFKFLNKNVPFGETWNPSTSAGLNLGDTKLGAIKFLDSGAFNDGERFIPAVIASADSNRNISAIGDDILKRSRSDLEDSLVVDQLFNLLPGIRAPGFSAAARPALQIKIFSLLSKSTRAAADIGHLKILLGNQESVRAILLLTGLEGTKLRTQFLNFINWFARIGPSADLAPGVIKSLKDCLGFLGWPTLSKSMNNTSEAKLRSLIYETVGALASKIDHGSDTGDQIFNIIRWLFGSLCMDTSSDEIFVSIDQALNNVLNSAAHKLGENPLVKLRSLLSLYMEIEPGQSHFEIGLPVARSAKFAAVRFANRCLAFSDVEARLIDFQALKADPDQELKLVEEAQKGLDPYWYRVLNPPSITPESTSPSEPDALYKFPEFSELIKLALPQSTQKTNSDNDMLYSNAHSATMAFMRNILLCEAFASASISFDTEKPHWEERLSTTLSTSEVARQAVQRYLRELEPSMVQQFIIGFTRRLSGETTNQQRMVEQFLEIVSLASNEVLKLCNSLPELLNKGVRVSRSKNQNLISRAFGIVVSQPEFVNQVPNGLLKEALSWRDAYGQKSHDARGCMLQLMYFYTRSSYRGRKEHLLTSDIQQFNKLLFDVLNESRDLALRETAIVCLGQMSLGALLNLEYLTSEVNLKLLQEKIHGEAKKGNEPAILALGRLAFTYAEEAEASSELLDLLLKSMYDLHEIRGLEIQLTVGEAMSVVAAGWDSKSLLTEFDVDAEKPKANFSPEILDRMLEKIISDCKASKPSLRRASAIWLLSLVQYCGHCSHIQERLRQCQLTFAWLLSDRDEIVQETASRGLSIVYEMGNQELKDDLVRDLVQSFTAEGSNLGGGKVSADTELFEPGALPTGEGSVTTYKDIVGLASEVGDPSLVYRFMSLASNNSVWSSRAAFGRFGLSSVLSDSNINGYLARHPKIYPKLYRYRFDPNPNVQKSMNDIWNALVKDPNAAINSNFDAIMEDLLKSILAGKEWRVRQASCAAIADLIQGRPVEKYDKFLGDILNKAFKVLDDIKLSVREEAFKLCQVLSSILLRTLEEGNPQSKKAQTMLKHIIPFLLQNGMESSVQEVQAYSIMTMTTLVKKCPAEALRPFVPDILEKFLTSLSSVEPQAVNYIHLNADKYGLTGQQIDKMRLSAIRTSPMMESVELHLLDTLDEETMKQIVPRLEHVLRSAIGLPSKVGCSRVLVILSAKTVIFQPYADRFIQITRKYVLDRNDTVSASYSNSIGYMMRLASDDEMLKTIAYAQKLYFDSEDTSHRTVAGEICHSMSKFANDRVKRVSATFLPFIFIGMHDTDNEVKEFFDKAWNDNVSGSRTILLYLQEILSLITRQLDSPQWAVKHASALATAKVVKSLSDEIDVATAKIVWPVLEKALAGKSWDGKEEVLKALVPFATRAKACLSELGNVKELIKVIGVREAKRNNAAYRPHALECLGQLSTTIDDLDVGSDAIGIISQVIEEHTDKSTDKMEIDGPSQTRLSKTEEDTFSASVECLLRCMNPSVQPTALDEQITQSIPLIETAVLEGGKATHGVLYNQLQSFFSRLLTMSADDIKKRGDSALRIADRLLFREMEGLVEAARAGRAKAVDSLTTVCEKGDLVFLPAWKARITEWIASERSGQVKTILSKISPKINETPKST